MRFLTHLLFGLLVAMAVEKAVMATAAAKYLFTAVATGTAILPDIDHAKSKLKRLGPFSVMVTFFFRHRGFVHSLWVPLLLALLLWNINAVVAGAAALGYSSHLFLDALTKKGIRPFPPLKFRTGGFLVTGGYAEQLVLALIIAALAYMLL